MRTRGGAGISRPGEPHVKEPVHGPGPQVRNRTQPSGEDAAPQARHGAPGAARPRQPGSLNEERCALSYK